MCRPPSSRSPCSPSGGRSRACRSRPPPALWHGHPERVRRLVRRMVVDREPGGRDVRFTDDDHAVLGREDPADPGHVLSHSGHPVIADGDGELAAPAQCLHRRDPQFGRHPLPLGIRLFTRTRSTLSPSRSRLKRDSDWVARARMRVVPRMAWVDGLKRDLQVVVRDVVAAVAVEREVRVADAGRAGAGSGSRRRGWRWGRRWTVRRRRTRPESSSRSGLRPGRPRLLCAW